MKTVWIVRDHRVITFPPLMIMGIVNLTPDSFSDGGQNFGHEKGLDAGVNYCRALTAQGAGILDIGGESTRPGSDFIDAKEEQNRILPVIRSLRADSTMAGTLVSVDTWRAETAKRALEAGADIINDISGGVFDERIIDSVAEYQAGFVLGHCPENPKSMQHAPHYLNVVEDVYEFFARRLEILGKRNLVEENVILDPCIGFGKNLHHNLDILNGLERLRQLGRPLLIGLSRKRMFHDLLGIADPLARDAATQTVTALLAREGVEVQRVHDVEGAVHALKIAQAMPGKKKHLTKPA